MSEIKTAGELGTELGEHCLEVAKDRFKEAIRPIYCSTAQGTPVHEGSCVLLKIDGKHVLLTASHVIDAHKINDTTLYVGGEHSLLKIEGEFWATEAKAGNRLKDRYDFAAYLMPDKFVTDMGNVQYISQDEIAPDRTDHHGRLYSIIGYPNTKNKSIDRKNYSVQSIRWHYFSTHQDSPDLLKKLSVTGEDHIFVGYDRKQSKDSNGILVGSVSTRGVSGGAVFDLGNFANPTNYARDVKCTPRLAGIFIEFHHEHHATVTTKIGVILKALRACEVT
ncbi:hypothetical protein [Noviherbaspirillum sedimenti]|uniref:Trypsin-like peptidase domain-containing protein n=1 Tax=Noviherbaspirillum sedimenti TaxID=2320865 RepID=A0A3A3G6U8_9BURK|nr:hypothetical protein [Noviherbaspirillum sedimenti]RJG02272.1 hypothetical protein D3878_12375 [Noviherbaspirillum sedimenti]